MNDRMNEDLKENLYGMRDVPNVLIYIPSTNEHITLCHLKNLTHKLNNGKSEIRFVNSLMNKIPLSRLYEMAEEGAILYFISPIRAYKDGKDSDYYWMMDNAQLIDFKFGVAVDGDPSEWTFVFLGNFIKPVANSGINKHIFNLIEEDVRKIYN